MCEKYYAEKEDFNTISEPEEQKILVIRNTHLWAQRHPKPLILLVEYVSDYPR